MIQRTLSKNIQSSLIAKKSILLLGPRQVGKSTLISSLKTDLKFNLAQQSTFVDFAKDPRFLEQSLLAKLPRGGIVFIDEVQRIPSLLNTIQYLIDEKKGYQFILTGSSARKLKRGKANLLPGRVHSYELGPIISKEMNYNFDTDKLIGFGSLPAIVTAESSKENKILLRSYSNAYLNEEIKGEALTKNLEGFTRFLFNVALDSAKFLDLTKVSKLAAVPRQTIQRYFEILEDTLIVNRLQSFAQSEKRRLIQHPKFYFFDNGVLNALFINFNVSQDRKGMLFENLFFNQLRTSLSYSSHDYRLSSFRTDAGAEVDIILELNSQIYALEIKTGDFKQSELGGFRSFENFLGKKVKKYVITMNDSNRKIGEVEVINWQNFLNKLGI